jgi:hypothetical protein
MTASLMINKKTAYSFQLLRTMFRQRFSTANVENRKELGRLDTVRKKMNVWCLMNRIRTIATISIVMNDKVVRPIDSLSVVDDKSALLEGVEWH